MASLTQYPVLSLAAGVTGVGTALNPQPGFASSYTIEIVLDTTGTVVIAGTVAGANYTGLLVTNLADGTVTVAITASGLYRVETTGLTAVQPQVTDNATGVTGVATLVIGG